MLKQSIALANIFLFFSATASDNSLHRLSNYEYKIKELKHMLWTTNDREKLVYTMHDLQQYDDSAAAVRIFSDMDNKTAADIIFSIATNNPKLIIQKLNEKRLDNHIHQNCLNTALFQTISTSLTHFDPNKTIERVTALLQAGAKPSDSLYLVTNYLTMISTLTDNAAKEENYIPISILLFQFRFLNILKTLLSRKSTEKF